MHHFRSILGIFAALTAIALGAPATAQTARVVLTCPSVTQFYQAGQFGQPVIDVFGNACGGGSSGGGGTVQNQVFVGAAWQNWAGALEGGVNVGLIDWNTSSQAHTDMTSSIPPGSALIGGTNLYDNGALNSLTNPAFMANGETADTVGNFTNGTQTTSVTNSGADGYATGLVSVHGTYGTASGVFEASDDGGTTFYLVACARSDGTASETGYTSLTNTNRQWTCPVGGNDSLRVRSTAVASGTVNVQVGVSAGAQPAPTAAPPLAVTPAAGTAHIIVTGGTAVTFVTGPVKGGYICNPTTAADENIATAENLYINAVTTATSSATDGTTTGLEPGRCFYLAAGQTTNVSANAATSSHNATVVVW